MYKLGIDVGGTNTDAVLIDENLRVIAEVKHPTSGNVFEGIIGAVQALLGQTQIDRSEIRQAMLGTTQCTNAIVERKNLAQIGLLRNRRAGDRGRAADGGLAGGHPLYLQRAPSSAAGLSTTARSWRRWTRTPRGRSLRS